MSTTARSALPALERLASALEQRAPRLKRPVTIAFAVVDEGPYLIDSRLSRPQPGWRKDADVSVLCNRRTVVDLVEGRFQYRSPLPEHLFVWGGQAEVWTELEAAFRQTTKTPRGQP